MGQGYIDVPLTSRQRQAAQPAQPAEVSLTLRDQPAEPAAGYEDVPIWSSPAAPTERLMEAPQTPIRSHVGDFAREIWAGVDPVAFASSIVTMARDIPGTVRGIGEAQGRLGQESVDAFKAGDFLTGTRKLVNYLTPLVGQGLDRSAELMEEGRYGAGLGAATSITGQLVAPALMKRFVPNTPIPVAPTNPNALERAAVEFGLREGIPVDAATATGNPVMRGLQWGAERTAGGSVVAQRARAAQARGFEQAGGRLAQRTAPATTTAEQAGQGMRDAVAARASQLSAQATAAYDRLRGLEAQQAQRIGQVGGVQAPAGAAMPFTSIPLAVDIAATKTALQPIYATLKREAELVPLMGDKARALTALDRLMQAPDLAPLSVADTALGELKSLARVDETFQRTAGQGVAAQAVTHLDRAVVDAARQGGRDVFDALMEGRAATVNKYKTIEVFNKFKGDEGTRWFNQITADQDAAATLLRQVQRDAPQALPQIGRAYLEGLLQKATAAGGFNRTDALFREWQNLGPATKRALFRDPGLVRDLDAFFLLAKRAAENPNPSGTAFQLALGAQGYELVANPVGFAQIQIGGAGLTWLLHNQQAVKVILRGLRMPKGNKAAATAAAAELTKIARESGVPLVPVPAVGETAPGAAPRP